MNKKPAIVIRIVRVKVKIIFAMPLFLFLRAGNPD
jgi:hypothetical protein